MTFECNFSLHAPSAGSFFHGENILSLSDQTVKYRPTSSPKTTYELTCQQLKLLEVGSLDRHTIRHNKELMFKHT